MSEPAISVIIPTFNRAPYVTRAIQSVLRQSYRRYEIIVIDDGSTDDTRQQLEPYSQQIRYLYQSNKGTAAAKNAGLKLSRGDWIAILDSDDLWEPEKLLAQMNVLAELGDNYRAGFTDCRFIGNSSIGKSAFEAAGLDAQQPSGAVLNPIQYMTGDKYAFCIQSMLASRDLVNEIGGFDETLKLWEDRELIFRLSFKTGFCYVSAPLVNIDRTPTVERLTDHCSHPSDEILACSELSRKKILANPEFTNSQLRGEIEGELIELYYDGACLKMQRFDFFNAFTFISKLRRMGLHYGDILRRLAARAAKKLFSSTRYESSNR